MSPPFCHKYSYAASSIFFISWIGFPNDLPGLSSPLSFLKIISVIIALPFGRYFFYIKNQRGLAITAINGGLRELITLPYGTTVMASIHPNFSNFETKPTKRNLHANCDMNILFDFSHNSPTVPANYL
jgi:hypothetical protein